MSNNRIWFMYIGPSKSLEGLYRRHAKRSNAVERQGTLRVPLRAGPLGACGSMPWTGAYLKTSWLFHDMSTAAGCDICVTRAPAEAGAHMILESATRLRELRDRNQGAH